MSPIDLVRAALKLGVLNALLLAPLAALSAQTKAPAKPDPNIIASPAELKARIPSQLRITRPDHVVFVPEVNDAGVNDTGNEHFLVFDGPDGSLMAIWTQSSVENYSPDMPGDQHIVFASSKDEGKTWTKPRIIAGPARAGEGPIASWAFPLVSKRGRIYVLYSQHVGKFDTFPHTTGRMDGIFSDDNGQTWSAPQNIPMPRTGRDNPDTSFPGNWICWQKPLRLTKDGRYYAGITRWTSKAVKKNPTKSWISHDSVVEFMRFDNIDDNPGVAGIQIRWFAFDKDAITVPFPGHPEVSACQEPSIVKLPDGRLFCVMRTSAGSPYWTVSADDGETWAPARRLLRQDGGEPLPHPLSPCPIYDVGGNEAGSGRYVLFTHNHDGNFKGYKPTDTSFHRRPIYLMPGYFKADADQPVWFDEPRFFMDHDGVSLGKPGTRGRTDLALYSSFTVRNGKAVLWYPDRKFFLLGRTIGEEWFSPASPPAARTSGAGCPNILFILADDLGIGDLACYGNPDIETPVIDSLARDGIRLTDHYAPSPLCAPSRAGFLTGRFNHRTGAVDVPSNRGLDRIGLSETTFGDYFRRAGYATALIGKWHNGLYCRDYLPHRRGFDLFYGFPNGGQDYWRWHLMRNDAIEKHDGRYLTDALNDEAIAFIRANRDRPFALFLAHHAPHSPFQAPEALVQKYRKRMGKDGGETVAVIYAMIEAMDAGLGRVFQTLKDEGLWEKTAIVFSSDNGAQLGPDGSGGSTMRYHADFSGNKGDVGEQGIRVPAIAAWPGHIPPGRTLATPIHGCDWLPTLYGLTGSPPPHGARPFDGVDIMPLLRGQPAPSLGSRVLPFQKNRYMPVAHSDAAIRRGEWKLVWPGIPATMKKDAARDNPSYERGILNPHWEMPLDTELADFADVKTDKPRLFNLSDDPAERHDLAGERPALAAELSGAYDAWFGDVIADWRESRAAILEHDRAYWKDRPSPDPAALFKDHWHWKSAPKGTDPKTANPLQIFRGYWSKGAVSRPQSSTGGSDP